MELKKHRAATHGDADLAAELVDRAVLDVGVDAGKVSAKLLYNVVSTNRNGFRVRRIGLIHYPASKAAISPASGKCFQ